MEPQHASEAAFLEDPLNFHKHRNTGSKVNDVIKNKDAPQVKRLLLEVDKKHIPLVPLGQNEYSPMVLPLKNERWGGKGDSVKICSSSVMPVNTVEFFNHSVVISSSMMPVNTVEFLTHSRICTGSNRIWDPGGTSFDEAFCRL